MSQNFSADVFFSQVKQELLTNTTLEDQIQKLLENLESYNLNNTDSHINNLLEQLQTKYNQKLNNLIDTQQLLQTQKQSITITQSQQMTQLLQQKQKLEQIEKIIQLKEQINKNYIGNLTAINHFNGNNNVCVNEEVLSKIVHDFIQINNQYQCIAVNNTELQQIHTIYEQFILKYICHFEISNNQLIQLFYTTPALYISKFYDVNNNMLQQATYQQYFQKSLLFYALSQDDAHSSALNSQANDGVKQIAVKHFIQFIDKSCPDYQQIIDLNNFIKEFNSELQSNLLLFHLKTFNFANLINTKYNLQFIRKPGDLSRLFNTNCQNRLFEELQISVFLVWLGCSRTSGEVIYKQNQQQLKDKLFKLAKLSDIVNINQAKVQIGLYLQNQYQNVQQEFYYKLNDNQLQEVFPMFDLFQAVSQDAQLSNVYEELKSCIVQFLEVYILSFLLYKIKKVVNTVDKSQLNNQIMTQQLNQVIQYINQLKLLIKDQIHPIQQLSWIQIIKQKMLQIWTKIVGSDHVDIQLLEKIEV